MGERPLRAAAEGPDSNPGTLRSSVNPGDSSDPVTRRLSYTQLSHAVRCRATTGEPVVVAQNVLNVRNTASANFSASATGILSYLAGTSETSTQLVWVDRSGKLIEKVGIRPVSRPA